MKICGISERSYCFFNMDLVQWLCDWTNENAEIMRADRPSYAKDWTDVDPPTMLRFFALLMYVSMSVVKSLVHLCIGQVRLC